MKTEERLIALGIITGVLKTVPKPQEFEDLNEFLEWIRDKILEAGD